MPRGYKVPSERRAAIYHAYCMGEPVRDIAEREGVSDRTIQNIVREQRGLRDKMQKGSVVAGDKRNGRLVSTLDPHRFDGTCVIKGRANSKSFVASSAKKAEEMWRKWCEGLADEQAFMDMVERKEPESEVDVTPTPVPEIEVRPWREVAEERAARIEELEARVAELERSDGCVPVSRPIYVIWAKTEQPSLYGVYQRMDDALKKVDELNDIAAFLGNSNPFEVEEVQWR